MKSCFTSLRALHWLPIQAYTEYEFSTLLFLWYSPCLFARPSSCVLSTKTAPLLLWLKNAIHSTRKDQNIYISLIFLCHSFCLGFSASWSETYSGNHCIKHHPEDSLCSNPTSNLQTTCKSSSSQPTDVVTALRQPFFVLNDLSMTDARSNACLVLLDLSAAFDTIDHSLLSKRLHDKIFVQGIGVVHIIFVM